MQLATKGADAFGNVLQPGTRPDRPGVITDAVVRHLELQVTVGLAEPYRRRSSIPGMLRRVLQRFEAAEVCCRFNGLGLFANALDTQFDRYCAGSCGCSQRRRPLAPVSCWFQLSSPARTSSRKRS